MADQYLRRIEKEGEFFVGYQKNQAEGVGNTYLFEHLRIVRILSGHGLWRIGNSIYEVKPGDFLLFNNVTPRQIVGVSQGPLVYELIGFSTRVFSLDTYYIKLFYSQAATRSPVLSADLEGTRDIHVIFDILKRRLLKETSGEVEVSGLINAVCSMIFELFRSEIADEKETFLPSRSAHGIVEDAIRYIEQNLCEIRDVAEVADRLHISRGHFHKVFTKHTGYTPKNFINYCRVVRFISLITSHDMNVLDAAMQSGFESASGFYKTFHSVCGMSPTEYLSRQGGE